MKLCVLAISACLLVVPASAKYSGGSGTAADPYQIATAVDLIALGKSPGDYDKHFILTADIDLDPNLPGRKVFDRAVIAPDTEPNSGYQGPPFAGTLDGQNHRIVNLTISGAGDLGLFGGLGKNAVVSDLGLENVNVIGTGENVDVGGLAGYSFGTITNSYSLGTVCGAQEDGDTGGLVGDNYGTIRNSYSTASVRGGDEVGGLVGYNSSTGGIVTNCYSTGPVISDYGAGGLVGANGGTIADCYSMGSVGGEESGGLVHHNSGRISNVYSTGPVVGRSSAGGLVAQDDLSLTSGGIWDIQTSGCTTSAGGTGRTTAEMMDPQILGLNGFANDSNWVLDAGRDYPRLAWEGTPGGIIPDADMGWLAGRGTGDNPYRIDTAEQLILLGKASLLWDKHFILGADIDLDPALPGRRIFGQAIFPEFRGIFDGKGQVISHLTIEGVWNLGLFGSLTAEAEVRNIGVVDVNITGSGGLVGGLAGRNLGRIVASYSTGSVSGAGGQVGGLVGSNEGGITASYSSALVSGQMRVGGLTGSDEGRIATSYSTGLVNGAEYVGGLVGYRGYGAWWGSVNSSLWDVHTSGQSGSAGGIGLTTAEMMGPNMLGLNGFANDPNWVLDAGRDYPRLAWQGTPGNIIPEADVDWLAGQGTVDSPYRIDTAEQLILLSKASILWNRHLILGTDIDLDPTLPGRRIFGQAVILVFTGVLDGSGHTISHLTIRGDSVLGLFGEVGPRGMVRNLRLDDVTVVGGSPAGALAGRNYGSLSSCSATGLIDSCDLGNVGGLVGCNFGTISDGHVAGQIKGYGARGGLVGFNTGTVSQSSSTGSVDSCGGGNVGGLMGWNEGVVSCSCSTSSILSHSGPGVGGLVGVNYGTVVNTYSRGWLAIGLDDYVGGLVGHNSGAVSNSYSAGLVYYDDNSRYTSDVGGLVGGNERGTILNCFWDRGSSRRGGTGGTCSTTAEMQTAKTFLDAGWDFVGETANGTEDIWWIDEGKDYPRLWWEPHR